MIILYKRILPAYATAVGACSGAPRKKLIGLARQAETIVLRRATWSFPKNNGRSFSFFSFLFFLFFFLSLLISRRNPSVQYCSDDVQDVPPCDDDNAVEKKKQTGYTINGCFDFDRSQRFPMHTAGSTVYDWKWSKIFPWRLLCSYKNEEKRMIYRIRVIVLFVYSRK